MTTSTKTTAQAQFRTVAQGELQHVNGGVADTIDPNTGEIHPGCIDPWLIKFLYPNGLPTIAGKC